MCDGPAVKSLPEQCLVQTTQMAATVNLSVESAANGPVEQRGFVERRVSVVDGGSSMRTADTTRVELLERPGTPPKLHRRRLMRVRGGGPTVVDGALGLESLKCLLDLGLGEPLSQQALTDLRAR